MGKGIVNHHHKRKYSRRDLRQHLFVSSIGSRKASVCVRTGQLGTVNPVCVHIISLRIVSNIRYSVRSDTITVFVKIGVVATILLPDIKRVPYGHLCCLELTW